MEGRPVWLASASLRTQHGVIIPAETWSEDVRARVLQILEDGPLRGIGDPARERAFRMCVTLCVHRGLSREEEEALPDEFWLAKPEGLAGAPLHVYYSRGVRESMSCQPCSNPTRIPLPGQYTSGEAYLPEDCGVCASCVSRVEVRAAAIRKWEGAGGVFRA